MDTGHIDIATTYLADHYDVAKYGDRLAYLAPETGEAVLVGPEHLADLGRRLEAEQEDAYSLWCAEAGCDERVTARSVATDLPDGCDLGALRAEAAAAGDMATVIGLDLLRDEIEAELDDA